MVEWHAQAGTDIDALAGGTGACYKVTEVNHFNKKFEIMMNFVNENYWPEKKVLWYDKSPTTLKVLEKLFVQEKRTFLLFLPFLWSVLLQLIRFAVFQLPGLVQTEQPVDDQLPQQVEAPGQNQKGQQPIHRLAVAHNCTEEEYYEAKS